MNTSKYDHLRSSLDLLIGQDPDQPDLLTFLEELEEEDARKLEEARLAREAAILAAREASQRARAAAEEASRRAEEASRQLKEAQHQAELLALEQAKFEQIAAQEEEALSQFGDSEAALETRGQHLETAESIELKEDALSEPAEDPASEEVAQDEIAVPAPDSLLKKDTLSRDEEPFEAKDEDASKSEEPPAALKISLPAHYSTPSFSAPVADLKADPESSEEAADPKDSSSKDAPNPKKGWATTPSTKENGDLSKKGPLEKEKELDVEPVQDETQDEATIPAEEADEPEVSELKTRRSLSDLEDGPMKKVEKPFVATLGIHGASLVGKSWLAHQDLFTQELGEDESPLVRSILASKFEYHEKYVKDDSELVRAWAAKTATDQKLLQDLSADLSPIVRLGVSENPNADATTLLLLSGDAHHEIFLSALENPSCPHSTLGRALANPDAQIVEAVLKNEALVADDFNLGMEKEGSHRYLYTRHAALSQTHFLALISSADFSERVKAIANSTRPIPEELAASLRQGSDTLVTAYAATPLSDEDFMTLSSHRSASVRRALAGNPAATPEQLEQLAKDTVPLVRAAVASNPATPNSVLFELASDMGISRTKRRLGRSKDHIDGDISPLASLVALNPSAEPETLILALEHAPEAAWAVTQHEKATPNVVISAMETYAPVVELTDTWARPLAKSLLRLEQAKAGEFVESLEEFSGIVEELKNKL